MGLFDWVNKGSAAKADAKFPKTTQQNALKSSTPKSSEYVESEVKESAPKDIAPKESVPKGIAPKESAPKDIAAQSIALEPTSIALKANEAKPSVTQKAAPQDDASASSKLKQVLDLHQDCKARLLTVLEGESDDLLDVDVISADKNCLLGKWIYGEGKKLFGNMTEYESARKAHAEFHVYAGEALKQHLQGNQVFADVILKTKFRNTSNKNQLMLTSLFNAAKFR